jgi:hypothetical protein
METGASLNQCAKGKYNLVLKEDGCGSTGFQLREIRPGDQEAAKRYRVIMLGQSRIKANQTLICSHMGGARGLMQLMPETANASGH